MEALDNREDSDEDGQVTEQVFDPVDGGYPPDLTDVEEARAAWRRGQTPLMTIGPWQIQVRWDDPNSHPLADLRTWKDQIQDLKYAEGVRGG